MATRILLTESQREELENQTLVFKYLAANVPVPPHLLFLITRPFLSSSSSFSASTFISSQHSRWNVYEMGMGMMGRKIDREPGRCRRTDGKKWRCSKQTSSPHSKYCDRHIHRGKNRSSSTKPLLPPPPPKLSLSSTLNLSPSSRVTRRRRRRSGYMDDDDDVFESLKRREKQPDLSCFILGTHLGTGERPTLMIEEKLKQRQAQDYDDEEEEKSSKMVYKFIDEWPSSKSSSSSVSTSLFI